MKSARHVIYFQIGGLLLLASGVILAQRVFASADWIAVSQQYIMHWGVMSALCYPLLHALCSVLLLPGGILSVGGGFFFGLWWGFLIVWVGNVTGAALSFFLSRVAGRRWLRPRLLRHPTYQALEPAVEREGSKIILLSQLNPLFPTSLLNYMYGLTTIRFGSCLLWIAIGQAPGLFLYAHLGTLSQLGLNLFRGKTDPHPIEYVIWAIGLMTSILLVIFLSRLAFRFTEAPTFKNIATPDTNNLRQTT